MCVSCACGEPNEDHGDKRNITLNQLEEAAQAANVSVEDVCENIEAATASSDQPVATAS
jgi:hypothetical protein